MRPPIGLVYRDDGVLILDPDSEIQAAMRLVFETFERTGSAMQTARLFREQGLRFPRRIRKGVNKGDLHWVAPAHSRILQVLHNPRYGGAFVYGRVRCRRLPDGKHATTKVPRSQWQFVIPDVHVGYISWQQFEVNQKRLADNALGFGGAKKMGPPREGPALLQGRVLCGICGERMSIHYNLLHQQVVPTYVCQQASVKRAEKVCQRVPGGVVDQAISNLLLELMEPMTLQVALAVQQEVEARVNETQALRRKHVERAQYEAELARRRYMQVDPENRLVADSLEAEWNSKLRILAEAQQQYDEQTQKQRLLIDCSDKRAIALPGDRFSTGLERSGSGVARTKADRASADRGCDVDQWGNHPGPRAPARWCHPQSDFDQTPADRADSQDQIRGGSRNRHTARQLL